MNVRVYLPIFLSLSLSLYIYIYIYIYRVNPVWLLSVNNSRIIILGSSDASLALIEVCIYVLDNRAANKNSPDDNTGGGRTNTYASRYNHIYLLASPSPFLSLYIYIGLTRFDPYLNSVFICLSLSLYIYIDIQIYIGSTQFDPYRWTTRAASSSAPHTLRSHSSRYVSIYM